MATTTFSPVGPYDLALSVGVGRRFTASAGEAAAAPRFAARIAARPARLDLRQTRKQPPRIEVRSSVPGHAAETRRVAGRMLFSDLDLKPFYRLAKNHPVLGPVTRDLRGLKPLRPPQLFDMLVLAVTEQQISMAAARGVRERLLRRFGESAGDLRTFPSPDRLARAPLSDLAAAGLSRRKAESIRDLAQAVEAGRVDLAAWETRPDEAVFEAVCALRGFGAWSAAYVLVRGLGRADALPADDLGIRTVAGRYLGRGARLTAAGVRRKLAPLAPYRGLAAFYLLAHAQRRRQEG